MCIEILVINTVNIDVKKCELHFFLNLLYFIAKCTTLIYSTYITITISRNAGFIAKNYGIMRYYC